MNLRKLMYIMGSIPSKIYNFVIFSVYRVDVSVGTEINGKIFIRGHGKIEIGKNNVINSGFCYNPIGGTSRAGFIIYSGATLRTGSYVGLSNVIISSRSSVQIGDYSIVGAGTKIYDHDFHPLNSKHRNPDDESQIQTRPIKIGSHVFVGADCIILKGTIIGDNAVIGAGSVVSGYIPPNEIWAGNPAKYIKKVN